MMRTVRLYGSMRKQFGPSFQLDVRSIAEAAHALGCQLPGFRRAIETGVFKIVLGPSQKKGWQLDDSLITFGLPAGDLHVLPVVAGSGGRSGGWGKLIVGSLIAAASWAIPGGQILASLGISIALSGASSLLTPKKKNTSEQSRRSYMFEGGSSQAAEGACVPVVIGRAMCNPLNISLGVSTARSTGQRS